MKTLLITPTLQDRITAVRTALASYVRGCESAATIELPKLELADALLEAVAALDATPVTTRTRLADVPRPRPAVVAVPIRPKRRRRA